MGNCSDRRCRPTPPLTTWQAIIADYIRQLGSCKVNEATFFGALAFDEALRKAALAIVGGWHWHPPSGGTQ